MGLLQKYGGTSVSSPEKIKAIAKRLARLHTTEKNIVVVVSAMGKTTDHLLNLANDITPSPSEREIDQLLSTGEQQTIALLSMALSAYGCPSISLTGAQAGIQTHGPHTKNKISDIRTEGITEHLESGKIVVVAGFQGINALGDITTLGRGGSDTTAVALAAKLGFRCEVYTDVAGIYTIDPRVYQDAKQLTHISYDEMLEMASLGAGVMETRAVELGKKYSVPIYVAKAHEDTPGTLITEVTKLEEKCITGLSIGDHILMVGIQEVSYTANNIATIFTELAHENVNVDMISQTAPSGGKVDVSFTCPSSERGFLNRALKKISIQLPESHVVQDDSLVKLSVVGIGMMNHSGVAAQIFKLFADHQIDFKQVTTSEISISYTIPSTDKQRAVMLIAQHFNL